MDSDDKHKLVKIKVVVDKEAMSSEKDIDALMLDTLKHNEAFKDFVDSLKSFEPDNESVKNLYNLKTWNKSETTNLVKYTQNIGFGE